MLTKTCSHQDFPPPRPRTPQDEPAGEADGSWHSLEFLGAAPCSPAGPGQLLPNLMDFRHLPIVAAATATAGTCPAGCAVHLPHLVQREHRLPAGHRHHLRSAGAPPHRCHQIGVAGSALPDQHCQIDTAGLAPLDRHCWISTSRPAPLDWHCQIGMAGSAPPSPGVTTIAKAMVKL